MPIVTHHKFIGAPQEYYILMVTRDDGSIVAVHTSKSHSYIRQLIKQRYQQYRTKGYSYANTEQQTKKD